MFDTYGLRQFQAIDSAYQSFEILTDDFVRSDWARHYGIQHCWDKLEKKDVPEEAYHPFGFLLQSHLVIYEIANLCLLFCDEITKSNYHIAAGITTIIWIPINPSMIHDYNERIEEHLLEDGLIQQDDDEIGLRVLEEREDWL